MSTFLSLVAAGALATAQAQAPTVTPQLLPAQNADASNPAGQQQELLTLEEALKLAQEASLDLEVLRARAAQAETISARAWAQQLPQLSVGGSYTYNSASANFVQARQQAIRDVGAPQDPPGETLPGAPTPYVIVPFDFIELEIQKTHGLAGQAELRQVLFAPELWAAIRMAGLSEKVAELNIENARREVLFAVAQAFYGVATLQESVKVNEVLLEVARAHEKDAQIKVDTGVAPKLTLLRAQLDRSRAEQDVVRAQTALLSSRLGLATLLNRRPNFEVAQPPEPEVSTELERGEVVKLADEAILRRPDIEATRVQLQINETDRASAWAKYLPSLALNGRFMLSNAAGFTGRPDTWAVGVGLSWNLFDGGLREATIRESSAKLREARVLKEQAERRTRDEVYRARLDLESARANRLKAEDSARLARESAALAELQFKAGMATYIEASDANTVLTQAEIGLLTERLNEQLAALQLRKAAGLFAEGGSL